MIYESWQNRADYTPALLSNGDISLAVDAQGVLLQGKNTVEKAPGAYIFRAGRRQMRNDHLNLYYDLFTFGTFGFSLGAPLASFTHELVLPHGYQRSTCNYGENRRVDSRFFVHQDHPLFALAKHYHGKSCQISYTFTYINKENRDRCAFDNALVKILDNKASISFVAKGQDTYRGEMRLYLDTPCDIRDDGSSLTFSFEAHDNDRFCFYIYMEDDLFVKDPAGANDIVEEIIKNKGFDTILEENSRLWQDYFDLGFVKTADQRVNDVYMTALYHLRCSSTRWSIPVGIYDNCWEGRYFTFDEYYGANAFLRSNRLELAKRVPAFRLECCLKKAIARASASADPKDDTQARFCFTSNEYGDAGMPNGYWIDHVFQMPIIALGAYEYYEYSLDKEFLARCYPMIRACAKFYTQNMIYYDAGKPYLGKCTDLERLGASKERAFMTTCSAISLLKICADSAKILETDEKYAGECEELSNALYDSLPHNGERYVPYPDCPQRSIGVFSGKFPFDVLDPKDPMMQKAFLDFIEHENVYGNMYKMGKKVSPWYAVWKAQAYARCKMGKEAMEHLVQSFESVGVFGEMFEINENSKRLRPWFMTAAGVFVSTVSDMLLCCEDGKIELLPAFEGDVEFRLSAKGGYVIQAKVENGKLVMLKVSAVNSLRPKIYFKGQLYTQDIL